MTCKDCKQRGPTLAQRLNKRVTISKVEITPGAGPYGGSAETLVPVCTVWAAVEPLRGREYFAAGRESADVTTRIRIRYRKDVDRTMVVSCGGVDFEIQHIIDPEFRHKEMQLMCKERQ